MVIPDSFSHEHNIPLEKLCSDTLIPIKASNGIIDCVTPKFAANVGSIPYVETSLKTMSTFTDSTVVIPAITINPGGNVGIGIENPSTKLHIKSNPTGGTIWKGQIYVEPISDDDDVGITLNTTRGDNQVWSIIAGSGSGAQNFRIFDSTDKTDRFTIDESGNVIIGTIENAKAKLHVSDFLPSDYPKTQYGALTKDGADKVDANSLNKDASIYAKERIIAKEFDAFSDERIKEITGISNSSEDLGILNKIKITDYTQKDPRYPIISNKKVIGQQIYAIYPQAVSLGTDIINDIMKDAYVIEDTIYLENHGLSVGDIVNIVFEDDDSVNNFEVLSISDNEFIVSSTISHYGKAFVVGTQVDDFHYVDYDALSMLTISAVQEQQKIIEEQRQILEQLILTICSDYPSIEKCSG